MVAATGVIEVAGAAAEVVVVVVVEATFNRAETAAMAVNIVVTEAEVGTKTAVVEVVVIEEAWPFVVVHLVEALPVAVGHLRVLPVSSCMDC